MTNDVLNSELQAAGRRAQLATAVHEIWQKFSNTKDQYDRIGYLNGIVARENVTQSGCLLAFVWIWAIAYWNVGLILASSDEPEAMTGAIVGVVTGSIPPLISYLAKRSRQKNAAKARAEMGEIYNSLWQHYQSVPDNPIAFEYSDPYSLQAIYTILQNGKANDIREAILVLDNEKYQSSMLNMQGSILEEARGARSAATAAAVFSGIAAIRR